MPRIVLKLSLTMFAYKTHHGIVCGLPIPHRDKVNNSAMRPAVSGLGGSIVLWLLLAVGDIANASSVSCGGWPGPGITSLFSSKDAPPAAKDANYKRRAVLGVNIVTAGAGEITAIRYLKGASADYQTHHGRIYTWPNGELVARTVSFKDDACTGNRWVRAALLAPLRTKPGARYVVAMESMYFYAETPNGLASPRRNGSLSTVVGGSCYGFTLGEMPKTPSANGGKSNYWIDGKWTTADRARRCFSSARPETHITSMLACDLCYMTRCGYGQGVFDFLPGH